MDFHDKGALITAATLDSDKPIAFLVGSPLSTKDGVGVPGVAQMLDLAREEIRQRAPHRLPNFEDAIRGKSGGDTYQATMSWLNGNFRQLGVDRFVAAAVRRARKDSGTADFSCDGNHCDWHIAPGTQQLASLICRHRDRFPGPVLTTNFDPLLLLAIEACHGSPRMNVMLHGDKLEHRTQQRPGDVDVVYLHGFWRHASTRHSAAQLTAPRTGLKDSLKEILRQKILIVAGYGGWDDVFTKALAEVAADDAAQLDVLWCFRDSDSSSIERNYQKLLQNVRPAIEQGTFVAYRGIDCHSIFGEIAAALPVSAASPVSTVSSSLPPIVGWQEIAPAFLDALPPLTNDEIIRYFDGAVPTWRHAVSSAIPRRQDVTKLSAALAKVANDKTGRSMHLIRAAGGEGKSTLLLQAAADAARAGGWSVLWRTSPKEGISPEQVANLDPSRRWLIVADDADNIVPGLADSAYRLSHSWRSGVHFLLAARDADWKNGEGDDQPWAEWLDYSPDIVLRDISPADAEAVVTAWEKAGPDGLRELGSLGDHAQRIAAFESAVLDAKIDEPERKKLRERDKPKKGSFFGGLLAVRFGQNGLQAHVRAFLQRLKTVPIERGNGSLFDALLYVAACHGTGIPGIDERVLADLTGVPREWVERYVERPLGEEAAAVQSAGHVLTRHSRVAAAILVEAEQSLGVDLAEVWAQLVRQTVQTSKNGGVSYDTHPKILHAGPRLQERLPQQLSEDRRKAIAIAAVNASIIAMPKRLDCVVDLGKTYRHADEPELAAQVFRDHLASASATVDHNEVIRGYWYEWGVCEGLAGDDADHRAADAWLQGLSLSDHLNPAPITQENEKTICAGLGVAFGKLAQPGPACPYAKARRAVAYLGRLTNPDPKTASYFDRHDREGDKLKTPHPRDVPEAIAWLTAGLAQAGRELQDSFLKALARPEEVRFQHLRTKLSPASGPSRPRPLQRPRPSHSQRRPAVSFPELEAAFDEAEPRQDGSRST